jgi:hypothetical protein
VTLGGTIDGDGKSGNRQTVCCSSSRLEEIGRLESIFFTLEEGDVSFAEGEFNTALDEQRVSYVTCGFGKKRRMLRRAGR